MASKPVKSWFSSNGHVQSPPIVLPLPGHEVEQLSEALLLKAITAERHRRDRAARLALQSRPPR